MYIYMHKDRSMYKSTGCRVGDCVGWGVRVLEPMQVKKKCGEATENNVENETRSGIVERSAQGS